MNYTKPAFHHIAMANAVAHCVDGSDPGAVHECTTGTDFAVDNCVPNGNAAHSACNTGTAAANCVGGTGVGIDCVAGGTD